jgi:hypothetical protein
MEGKKTKFLKDDKNIQKEKLENKILNKLRELHDIIDHGRELGFEIEISINNPMCNLKYSCKINEVN